VFPLPPSQQEEQKLVQKLKLVLVLVEVLLLLLLLALLHVRALKLTRLAQHLLLLLLLQWPLLRSRRSRQQHGTSSSTAPWQGHPCLSRSLWRLLLHSPCLRTQWNSNSSSNSSSSSSRSDSWPLQLWWRGSR
jgi:hypothetical protein